MKQKYSNAIIIFFFLLISLIRPVSAITIEQIFKNFQKTYETTKNFSADFEETTYRDDTKSVAKGKLIFAKPNLLRKKYIDPNNPDQLAQLIVLDGKTSWSYVPLLNQVTRLESKDKNKALIPGIGESIEELKKKYNMKLVEDKLAKSKGIYHIELSPRNPIQSSSGQVKKLIETIEVWISSSDWIPVQFSYKSEREVAGETSFGRESRGFPKEKGDMTIVMSFKNIKLDQDLPKSTFVFEVPEGAEVIDISDEKRR